MDEARNGLDDRILNGIKFENIIEPHQFAAFQPILMTQDQKRPERFNGNFVSGRFLL